MTTSQDRRHSQVGNASLELSILGVPLMMILGLTIVAGRVTIAGGSVEAAARDGARQASIARDPVAARSGATRSARDALRREGLQCTTAVSVDTSGFARPVGTTATVTVRVSCPVRLSDLLPGMPGTRTVVATFASPIDPYRGR